MLEKRLHVVNGEVGPDSTQLLYSGVIAGYVYRIRNEIFVRLSRTAFVDHTAEEWVEKLKDIFQLVSPPTVTIESRIIRIDMPVNALEVPHVVDTLDSWVTEPTTV